MGRPAVEFLDPSGLVRDDAPEPADPRPRIPTAVALAGWLGAAGLAVAAPFTSTYTADYLAPDGSFERISVDGWGRSRASVAVQNFGAHGLRVGIVAVAVAVLLVLLAAHTVWRFHRDRASTSFGTVTAGLAVALGSALAATGVSLWLSIDSVLSNYRAINRANLSRSGNDTPVPVIHTQFGPSLWLVTAATALTALSCAVVLMRRGPAHAVTKTTPAPAAEPLPQLDGAELLG